MSQLSPHRGVAVVHGRRQAPSARLLPERLRDAGPALSVGLPIAGTALVQALAPSALALPVGQSRFDVAGAWAVLQPGALAGLPVPAPTAAGWVQLGLLQRLLLGGTAQTVLGATHGVLILCAVVSVGLLWTLLRRTGSGLLAAGAAAAAFGLAPEAVAIHGSATTADLAAVWLLLAALLATRRRGTASFVGAGIASGLAVLANPLALAALPIVALLERAAPRRALRPVEQPADRPGRRLAVSGAAFGAVLALAALVSLVLAAVPVTAAGRTLAALAAAAPAPGAGLAGPSQWAALDPLSLLVAAVAVIAVAVRGRRTIAGVAVLVALLSLWPAGHDALAPIAVLLPVVAAAIAATVDAAATTLGHRLFAVSVVGAGWLMGVAALVVVSLAIWLGSLAGRGAAVPLAADAAARWIATGVPAGQTALVSLAAWPDASERAHATVGWYATGSRAVASSVPFSSADWVVADDALRRTATGTAATAVRTGRAVAHFGSGATAVEVLEYPLSPTSAPSTSQQSGSTQSASAPASSPNPSQAAAIQAARQTAGTELASNPSLTVDAADRALLTSGRVDARVSIALGQLLSGHRLTVAAFPVVAGESGARRQVLVAAVDGHAVPGDSTAAGDVLRYFSALRGDYAIQTVDEGTSGVLVTFPVNSTFVPTS